MPFKCDIQRLKEDIRSIEPEEDEFKFYIIVDDSGNYSASKLLYASKFKDWMDLQISTNTMT